MSRYVTQSTQPRQPGYTQTPGIFGTGNYLIYGSSGTFVPPRGVSKVRVSVLGAGGGAGGNWAITRCNADPNASPSNNMAWAGMNSFGAGGGGGGFAVGTASVEPGCSYCIVVGAAGTTSTTHYYALTSIGASYSYGGATGCASCIAGSGTAGGYSCAFGIIACGGGGGSGARCGFCSLTASAANTTACSLIAGTKNCDAWPLLCPTLAANTTAGGCGGTAIGGYYIACGANGSNSVYNVLAISPASYPAPSWTYGQQGTYGCGNLPYGGASGSIFGNGVNDCICDPYGGKAFDSTCCSEDYLVSKYDLDYPKFPGKTVFSTSVGSFAATGTNYTVSGCTSTPGPTSQYFLCYYKCLWSSNNGCNYCCCYSGGPSYSANSWKFYSNGCGAGALPYFKIGCAESGATLAVNFCDCAFCGSTAGNGLVIVEW